MLNPWLNQLGGNIISFADFLSALRARHDYFHEKGCRLTDHGMRYALSKPCDERKADQILAKVREG
ncbi:glucuronate isomerase, partial [bacterium]|nr:glucuronate isomerase [bacterium]